MISSKSNGLFNPDGTIKNTFNPTNFNEDTTSDFARKDKDNIFVGNNTFTTVTATSSVTAPNITDLTTDLNDLTAQVNAIVIPSVDFNAVYLIPSTLHSIATATTIPDVILGNVAGGSTQFYLPFLTTTTPSNYSGRTFVIHCRDNGSMGANTLTVQANNTDVYDKFGVIVTSRVMSVGSIQRYYTFLGKYYEV